MRIHPAIFIQQTLRAYFPNATWYPLDQAYATLTLAAWADAHHSFTESMWAEGLPQWLVEKGDCDDWAWLFRADVIKRNWHQSQSRVPVAFFYLHYVKDSGVDHAINAALVRDGERLYIAPIEPQPDGGLVQLTPTERASCKLVIG